MLRIRDDGVLSHNQDIYTIPFTDDETLNETGQKECKNKKIGEELKSHLLDSLNYCSHELKVILLSVQNQHKTSFVTN